VTQSLLLRADEVIRKESALGRPVLSANQVLGWHALRLARVPVPVVNYGTG